MMTNLLFLVFYSIKRCQEYVDTTALVCSDVKRLKITFADAQWKISRVGILNELSGGDICKQSASDRRSRDEKIATAIARYGAPVRSLKLSMMFSDSKSTSGAAQFTHKHMH